MMVLCAVVRNLLLVGTSMNVLDSDGDFETCREFCNSFPGCRALTNFPNNTCIFFESITGGQQASGALTYLADPDDKDKLCDKFSQSFASLFGVSINGTDVHEGLVPTHQECMRRSVLQDCEGATFDTRSGDCIIHTKIFNFLPLSSPDDFTVQKHIKEAKPFGPPPNIDFDILNAQLAGLETWTYYGKTNSLYKAINSGTFTWNSASAECAHCNATLVSLASIEELRFVRELARMAFPGTQNAFIGLKRDAIQYPDGSLVDYTSYTPPRQFTSHANMCFKLTNTNSLVLSGCSIKDPFVCRRPAGQECSSPYKSINGACITLYAGPLSWEEALEYCNASNAFLASIHQQTSLSSFSVPFTYAYIGARVPPLEWSDGSPMTATTANYTLGYFYTTAATGFVLRNLTSDPNYGGKWDEVLAADQVSNTAVICKKRLF